MLKRYSLSHIASMLAKISHRGGDHLSRRDKLLKYGIGAQPISLLKKYVPEPSRHIIKIDKNGQKRTFCEPHEENKALQQLILAPMWDLLLFFLSSHCYSKKGSSHLDAVRHVENLHEQGYVYCLKLDIRKCFENINHTILCARLLQSNIFDPDLIKFMLKLVHIKPTLTGCGIPMGHPLSSLFMNLYFLPTTRFMEDKNFKFYQYADDFALFFKTLEEAGKAASLIKKHLMMECRLELNSRKTLMGDILEASFLGISLKQLKNKKIIFCIADENILSFQNKVETLILSRCSYDSFSNLLKPLNRYIKHWSSSFYIAQSNKQLKQLDEWVIQTLLKHVDATALKEGWQFKKRRNIYRALFKCHDVAKRLASLGWKGSYQALLSLRCKELNTTCKVTSVFETIQKKSNNRIITINYDPTKPDDEYFLDLSRELTRLV